MSQNEQQSARTCHNHIKMIQNNPKLAAVSRNLPPLGTISQNESLTLKRLGREGSLWFFQKFLS